MVVAEETTSTSTSTSNNNDNDNNNDDEASLVLQSFSVAAKNVLDQALDALASTTSTTSASTPQQRLMHLLQLQHILQNVVQDRVAATRNEWRDLCISQSRLLSLSHELLFKITQFLDETALMALELSTRFIYDTHNSQDGWLAQWQFLDHHRHSKSALQHVTPRRRGIQFAMASWKARAWEQRLMQQLQEAAAAAASDASDDTGRSSRRGRGRRRRHHCPPLILHCSTLQAYTRQEFVHDFGYFFQDPTQAGIPPMEFFLRITYNNHNDSDNHPIVLLEGFQSNFESLRHVSDARDEGFQTYIGFIHDRAQAVMVRNDLNRLQHYMGLEERYLNMNSDDSQLESDEEEEEFHLLQWPEPARREFLNRTTITLLRCSLLDTNNNNNNNEEETRVDSPMILGSTTGYHESDQHFAMFRPIHLVKVDNNNNDNEDAVSDDATDPRDNTTTTTIPHDGSVSDEEDDDDDENDRQGSHNNNNNILKIGLGCGGGSSLHIVMKWER